MKGNLDHVKGAASNQELTERFGAMRAEMDYLSEETRKRLNDLRNPGERDDLQAARALLKTNSPIMYTASKVCTIQFQLCFLPLLMTFLQVVGCKNKISFCILCVREVWKRHISKSNDALYVQRTDAFSFKAFVRHPEIDPARLNRDFAHSEMSKALQAMDDVIQGRTPSSDVGMAQYGRIGDLIAELDKFQVTVFCV